MGPEEKLKKLTVVEETVMLAIFQLLDNAYSVTIHQKILEMTGKDMIIGTLFNTLKQLLNKGYIQKTVGKPTRGGKNIMLYKISDQGLKALEQTREMHNRIWNDMPDMFCKGS